MTVSHASNDDFYQKITVILLCGYLFCVTGTEEISIALVAIKLLAILLTT